MPAQKESRTDIRLLQEFKIVLDEVDRLLVSLNLEVLSAQCKENLDAILKQKAAFVRKNKNNLARIAALNPYVPLELNSEQAAAVMLSVTKSDLLPIIQKMVPKNHPDQHFYFEIGPYQMTGSQINVSFEGRYSIKAKK